MPTYIIFYLIVFVATFAVVSLTNQAKVKKNKNLLDEAKKEGSKVIITKDTILDSDYNISLFLKISGIILGSYLIVYGIDAYDGVATLIHLILGGVTFVFGMVLTVSHFITTNKVAQGTYEIKSATLIEKIEVKKDKKWDLSLRFREYEENVKVDEGIFSTVREGDEFYLIVINKKVSLFDKKYYVTLKEVNEYMENEAKLSQYAEAVKEISDQM